MSVHSRQQTKKKSISYNSSYISWYILSLYFLIVCFIVFDIAVLWTQTLFFWGKVPWLGDFPISCKFSLNTYQNYEEAFFALGAMAQACIHTKKVCFCCCCCCFSWVFLQTFITVSFFISPGIKVINRKIFISNIGKYF